MLSQSSKSFDLNVNAPVFMPCPPAVENKALSPKTGIELALLNVYYCNARSLRNNLGELHDLLYSGKFKIICFAESWLCSKLFNDAILDPRSLFNIYRRDRISHWPAGGVCIFISKSVQSFENEIDRQMFPDAEIVSVCAIFPDNLKLIIVCVYLPPNLSTDLFGQSMQCIERICASSSESILIVGDFNLPDIDWKDFTSPETVKNKG